MPLRAHYEQELDDEQDSVAVTNYGLRITSYTVLRLQPKAALDY